jgi:lysozyme
MSIVNLHDMQEQLILHEGIKLRPYRDTVGKITIGVGYNVTDRGWSTLEETIGRKINRKRPAITRDEAMKMLAADIDRFEGVLRSQFPTYDLLDEIRKRVLVDLAFNLAWHLTEFVKTKEAIETAAATKLTDDWNRAADMLLQSKWARQVKTRAVRLTDMLRTGLDYIQK